MVSLTTLGANLNKVTIGDTVVLFSYNTAVAFTRPLMNWIVDPTKYSRTTSRHINLIIDKRQRVLAVDRAAFNDALIAAVDPSIDEKTYFEAKNYLESWAAAEG